jgi:hypothetical protein
VLGVGIDWAEEFVRHEASVRREAPMNQGGVSPPARLSQQLGRS